MHDAARTARCILRGISFRPHLAVALGSGFSALCDAARIEVEWPYGRLPGFLPSRVDGHAGKLVAGYLADVPVLLLCGRSHYYEGHSMADITFPVRVLAACGVGSLLLTNAAGGINPRYRAGDFMCLVDHLNWMGDNPLRGERCGAASRFVDLTQTYDPRLVKLLGKAARQARVRLHHGIYAAVAGPCYETPAEVRALARLGADAVGMSTVPEAIVGRECGLRLVGLSCITNLAAGLSAKPITHQEVLATGGRVGDQALRLVSAFARLFATRPGPGGRGQNSD